jgi:signal transduction histidine kinase
VSNLFCNAIKYGEGKPIEIGVSTEGDLARLVVRDHGVGISPDARGRLFGRFERASSSRHYGGFGLGLYVVRHIVERLGGNVGFESELGKGTTFFVTLKRSAPTDTSAAPHPF